MPKEIFGELLREDHRIIWNWSAHNGNWTFRVGGRIVRAAFIFMTHFSC
jgi:hypothetical protein